MKPDWHDLVQRHLEGTCSSEECAVLHAALREDASVAALYLRYAGLEVGLEACARSSEATQLLISGSGEPGCTARRRPRVWGLAAAAALLLAVAGGSVWERVGPRRPVAELMEVQGARWQACSLPTEAGCRLPRGMLRLAEGIARFRFGRGAEVTLEGPAELELLDSGRCRLLRGSLVAHVPEAARGFAVLIPSAELVDHGTDFGVTTDGEGNAEVRVLHGEVELRHFSGIPPLRLAAREMAVLTPAGVLPRAPFQAEPWRPYGPGLEGGFDAEITTRTGRGAAVYVSEPRTAGNQSATLLLLKNCMEEGYGRRVVLRFDLGGLPDAAALGRARLTLNLAPSGFGYASQGDDARVAVYAVTRDDADLWDAAGLVWAEQPAFDPDAGRVNEAEAVRVGEFTVPRGVQTGSFVVEDQRLLERIRCDSNRLLTLVLVRENPIRVGGGVVLGIAGNRHPTLSPPRLEVR